MTPEQILALLQLFADLRAQIGAQQAEITELRARLAKLEQDEPTESG